MQRKKNSNFNRLTDEAGVCTPLYKGEKYVAASILEEVRVSTDKDTVSEEYVVRTTVNDIEEFPNNTYVEKSVYRLGVG